MGCRQSPRSILDASAFGGRRRAIERRPSRAVGPQLARRASRAHRDHPRLSLQRFTSFRPAATRSPRPPFASLHGAHDISRHPARRSLHVSCAEGRETGKLARRRASEGTGGTPAKGRRAPAVRRTVPHECVVAEALHHGQRLLGGSDRANATGASGSFGDQADRCGPDRGTVGSDAEPRYAWGIRARADIALWGFRRPRDDLRYPPWRPGPTSAAAR